jgi:uncharacterized membrane protein YkvA (DUF1232 family)
MPKQPNKLLSTGLISRLFEDFKLLCALVRDYYKGVYRDVSIRSILLFCAGVLYILSPLDIIPDINLGIGQIDDAAVLLLCLNFLEKDLHKYKDWKATRNKSGRSM